METCVYCNQREANGRNLFGEPVCYWCYFEEEPGEGGFVDTLIKEERSD